MTEHAVEIKKLFEEGNVHYVREAGDLAVLCMEMIMSAGADPDGILAERLPRFRERMSGRSGASRG